MRVCPYMEIFSRTMGLYKNGSLLQEEYTFVRILGELRMTDILGRHNMKLNDTGDILAELL